ncbi:MotE family protein [Palleronia sp.]|uniref:MotE family protein n=1 Tax=Palleronia sp. TaxID=1940284 RepID=UPI0035C7F651
MPVLAGLLVASGVFRLGDGPVATVVTELLASRSAHASSDSAPPEDEIAGLLAELNARQAELDERATELDSEADRVAEGREALRAQLDEVEKAEAELRELLKLADTAAEDDLSRLAQVYSAMKPAEAAALFEQMPPAFAAGFLGMMAPPASAAILAGMPPDAAYAITVMLAGRHADLPKE